MRAADAPASAYARSVRVVHAAGRRVARFLERYDVLLTPTMATPPLEIGRLSLSRADVDGYREDLMRTVGFTQLFNAAGNPAMSVPLASTLFVWLAAEAPTSPAAAFGSGTASRSRKTSTTDSSPALLARDAASSQ